MNKIVFSLIMLLFISYHTNAQKSDTTQLPKDISLKVDTTAEEDESKPKIIAKIDTLPKWFYSLGLDGNTSSGNVNRQLFNVRTSLNFESKKSILGFFSNPKFQYGTNSNILQERELFLDLNSTLFYAQNNVYVLIFGSFEQSNLRKITSRYNAGVGVGWKISGGMKRPKSRFKLSLTNALVKEVVDFESKEDKEIIRNSTRLKLIFDIIPNKMTFQSVAFLQPSLTDNYYRWNSLSSFSFKVGKHIALLASFENNYENFNVVGIQNSQTNATVGLTFSGSN